MAEPPLHEDAADILNDDYLVLSTDQAKQIDRFREDIHLYESNTEKYELCAQMRNQLLDQHTGQELLIAAFERVMCAECPEYKEYKENRPLNRSKRSKEDDAAQWERFIGVATNGSDVRSKCLPPLKVVSRRWGRDKVQHYQWAGKGENYCHRLSAAAHEIHDWDEVVTKLNRLIQRRVQLPRRRLVKESANPIEPVDLNNLKAWSHKYPFIKDKDSEGIRLPFEKLAVEDLLTNYGFDKYGLIVQKKFAIALPETDRADTVEPNQPNLVVADASSANDDPDTAPSSAEDTATEIPQEGPEDTVAGDIDDCPDIGADHTGIVERLQPRRQDPLKAIPTRRRITSLPDISQYPVHKKQRLEEASMQKSDASKHDDEASRPSRIRRGTCTCPAAFRSAVTDKTQRLALLRSGNKEGFRNLCHPCLRTFAGSWGMYNSKISHETMHERLQALYLHRSDIEAFRQEHKTWFRVDPNDHDLSTVWKYQPQPLQHFTFNQKRVFERFAGLGSWGKFRSKGTIIVDGLFKYLWDDEAGIGPFIDQEFRMYDHHLNIIPGRPDMGWARNMYHSVIQQLMSQDPVWYALITASRIDGKWRLVVFPYNAKFTKVNQSAAFLHLDINIWDYLNGEPYDFTQTFASMDDEADDGCTVQVPRMVGAVFDRWCKQAAKRQRRSLSSTTDCKKLYNKGDRAKYGRPIPYPCPRGAVRLSLPTVVHGSTSSKRERKAISPWFFSVDEDHHTVERPCPLTWPELAQCHRDRVGPSKESLGDNPRPGVEGFHFPGAVLLRGCSALGDALLGHRRWDYEVMEEIGILLGNDECKAMEYVEKNRARLLQRAKEVYPLVEKAERVAYGDNSYFARG